MFLSSPAPLARLNPGKNAIFPSDLSSFDHDVIFDQCPARGSPASINTSRGCRVKEMPPFDALLGLWRGTTTLKSPSSDPKLAKSGHGNGKAGRSSEVGVGGIGLGADGVGVGVGSERAGAAKGGAAAKAGSGAPPPEGSEAQQTAASGKGSSGKSVGKAPQSKGRGKGSKGSAKPALECWYKGCFRPKESSQFYVIEEGRQSGKQDWTPLVGKTLCAACYCRYKDRGTLDRAVNIPLPKSAKRCTNKACEKPEDSTCFFKIEAGRKSGGRDWSSLEGEVLCAACYERYRSRGTLERHKNKPLDRSRRRCTYSRCDRPDHGEKFFLIEEGRSSGGKDWSSVVGQVMHLWSTATQCRGDTVSPSPQPCSSSRHLLPLLPPTSLTTSFFSNFHFSEH